MVHTKEKLFNLGLVRENATASKQLKVEQFIVPAFIHDFER